MAVNDTGTAVEAGGLNNGTPGSNPSGNVLTNDTDVDKRLGETKTVSAIRTGTEAGSGTAGSVGSALTGTYGTLTLNANGTYTYVVDNTNAAVQALRTRRHAERDLHLHDARHGRRHRHGAVDHHHPGRQRHPGGQR